MLGINGQNMPVSTPFSTVRSQTIRVGRVTPCAPSFANPRVRRAEDCPPYRPQNKIDGDEKTESIRWQPKMETTPRHFRQFSWLATALLGGLIIQMTGCESTPPESDPNGSGEVKRLLLGGLAPLPASGPEGASAVKQQALSCTPPPGQAGVYVVRPYHFYNDRYYANSAAFLINLDGQEMGSVGIKGYLFALVPPGSHTFGFGDFTAEAGKSYYFTATGAGLARFRHLEIAAIAEAEGQADVRQFKLSGDNRFELPPPPRPPKSHRDGN